MHTSRKTATKSFVKYSRSILRRKHQMLQQNCYVMTFVDVLTHLYNLRHLAAGNLTLAFQGK